MQVRFWGVRGSIAAPGADTVRTGGNTSCVQLRCGTTELLLDAGTGIRGAGEALLAAPPVHLTLLLSHLHWDHIQGLPFFAPLYRQGTEIDIYGPADSDDALAQALGAQMSTPCFPVDWHSLPSRLRLHALQGGECFALGDATVRCARLNHPGGVLGYRVDHGGASVTYATDTEHVAGTLDPNLLRLCTRSDVLIYDAMYTEAEYRGENGRPSRRGWGHSTWEAGVAVARAAQVGQLVLFHHDPQRTDDDVDVLESAATRAFPSTLAAREGLALSFDAGDDRRAA